MTARALLLSSLALRNVRRHLGRSLPALLSAVVAVAALCFIAGMLNGIVFNVEANSIEGETGAITVHRRGFFTPAGEDSFALIDDAEAKLAALSGLPNVSAAARRFAFEATLSNGRQSPLVRALAIEVAEYAVCPKRREIQLDGRGVEAGLVLGRELARGLGAAGTLTLAAFNVHGRPNTVDVAMAGRLDSPIPFMNKRIVLLPITAAGALFQQPGLANELVLAVADRTAIDATAQAVRERLGADYEVRTWAERDSRAARFVATTRLAARVLSIVLYVLVLGFVSSAMVSLVLERRRELGVMMALGARRRLVATTIALETVCVSFVGVCLGLLLGVLLLRFFALTGVTLRAPAAKPFVVRPFVEEAQLAAIGLITFGCSVLAAAAPVRVVSRLSPLAALREDV